MNYDLVILYTDFHITWTKNPVEHETKETKENIWFRNTINFKLSLLTNVTILQCSLPEFHFAITNCIGLPMVLSFDNLYTIPHERFFSEVYHVHTTCNKILTGMIRIVPGQVLLSMWGSCWTITSRLSKMIVTPVIVANVTFLQKMSYSLHSISMEYLQSASYANGRRRWLLYGHPFPSYLKFPYLRPFSLDAFFT